MGTSLTPDQAVSGDVLWSQEIYAKDGAKNLVVGRIRAVAEGTIKNGVVPSKIEFYTANSSGTLVLAFSMDSAQLATFAAAQAFTGLATFTLMPVIPVATVAAAGADQAGAAAITTGFTLVSAADGNKGVRLPPATAGLVAIVKNIDAANAVLKLYPASGDQINAITADAAMSVAAKTSALLVAYDTTTWYTVPLLPS